jgi:hypothetical protein
MLAERYPQFVKFAISFALTTLTLICNGQTNEFIGLWIGTARYNIETYEIQELVEDFEDLIDPFSENVTDPDSLISKDRNDSDETGWRSLDPPEFTTDTNYYHVLVILELKEDGSATIKPLGEQPEQYQWKSTHKANELLLEQPEPKILRMDSSNHLSLIIEEKDSVLTKILFEPLSPSSSFQPDRNLSETLRNYSWEYVNEPLTESSSHLLFENDTLIFSIFHTDSATYCEPGNWIIDEFSGHYFLFVGPNIIPFYLHLTNLQNEENPIISADKYVLNGYPFETVYPELKNYRLIGSELPERKTITRSLKKLIGSWNSIDNAFPVDYMHFNQEILSSFLTYEFRTDGTVAINFGGVVKDDHGIDHIDKTESANWIIASNGELIIFDTAYSGRNLAFFRFIDSNTLEIRREMRSLEGHLVDNMTFRMQRENN